MEDKKVVKIKLSTIILSIIIVVLVGVIVFFGYKLNVSKNAQTESDLKLKEIEEDYKTLEAKTNNYSEVIEEARNILLGKGEEVKENTTVSNSAENNTSVSNDTGKLNLGIISITLPDEWLEFGKFSIYFGQPAEEDGIYASYILKSNSNLDYGGTIYRIYVVRPDYDEDMFLDSQITIKTNSKYKVVGGTSTDVQFDEDDENNRAEFEYLSKYIDKIINSVEFN